MINIDKQLKALDKCIERWGVIYSLNDDQIKYYKHTRELCEINTFDGIRNCQECVVGLDVGKILCKGTPFHKTRICKKGTQQEDKYMYEYLVDLKSRLTENKFNVGDEVWTEANGNGAVLEVLGDDIIPYQVEACFGTDKYKISFTKEGRYSTADLNPTLHKGHDLKITIDPIEPDKWVPDAGDWFKCKHMSRILGTNTYQCVSVDNGFVFYRELYSKNVGLNMPIREYIFNKINNEST